ncbi:MAG: hypothetical protein Sapg2KO_32810 [Saprospiraceae bacterium]
MSISFIQVLKAEFQKTKNIWGLTLSLLGPLAVLLILIIGFINQAETATNEVNPWINFAKYTFQFFFFLYPLFAALAAFLLSNIEHKNRGFKQIFTLPAPKIYFYGSKVLILLFWILSSIVFAGIVLYLSGQLLGWIVPAYGFHEYNIVPASYVFLVRLYITLLSIIAIHFFLSLYWDNFIVTVGSAVFLLILGLIMYGNWKYAYLFPYSYSIQHWMEYNQGNTQIWTRESWISLFYALTFFSAGYLLISKKNIT